MNYQIFGTNSISTDVPLPSSKSISNRALILNALSAEPSHIDRISCCDDTHVLIKALKSPDQIINIGAAGTSMRFLTAYLSRTPGTHIITGTERMQNRPIHLLVDALKSLGADIEYVQKEGFPPLKIRGKALKGGTISLKGNISSQFISALLMIAPTMRSGLSIHLAGEVISVPYIRMTLNLMKKFGVDAQWENNIITIRPQIYHSAPFCVEADWSGASYWYQMAALANQANIHLQGLYPQSVQGDSKVVELFSDLGVQTQFTQSGVTLTKSPVKTKKMFYNFINEPDLAQTFVVTCCLLNIPFLFSGLQSLKIKETDRIEALKTEMKKLGYPLTERDGNILEWNGERCSSQESPVIHTYEDHRMAMAFAPVAITKETITIAQPEVVSKSYPNYWKDLQDAGFTIQKNP